MELRRRDYSGTTDPTPSAREAAHRAIAADAAAQGMVLLKNNGVLPLATGSRVALYGVGARYTIPGGTGSGSVNCRETLSVDRGLRAAGLQITTDAWLDAFDRAYAEAREKWMAEIYAAAEPGNFFSLYSAYSSHRMRAPAGEVFTKTEADTAVYVLTRISGESADRRAEKGDYYLSDVEESDLRRLSELYPNLIVVLNVGGVMDLRFLDEIPVAALVLMSQAGMEGGSALASVLTGRIPFSGKLTDTWAYRYEDYPCSDTFGHRNGNLIQEKYCEGIFVGYRYFDSFEIVPRFPFGFGLSYTDFQWEAVNLSAEGGMVSLTVKVTNTGAAPGREVLQLYAACPQKLRIRERRRLVAFGKTDLLQPGESRMLTVGFDIGLLTVYHTAKARYYLEDGAYFLLLGNSSDNLTPVARLTATELTVTEQLTNICPLLDALTELVPSAEIREHWDRTLAEMSAMALPTLSLDGMLPEKVQRPAPHHTREAEAILKKMSPLQKAQLVCGQPSHGSSDVIGAAAIHCPGAAGETANALTELGIGPMVLADGPAGLRLQLCYEINPADGSVYRMSRYEGLENRFFGKEFPHEGSLRRYQACTAIPVGTLLAQSFDPALLREVGLLIGREMQELGVTLWLAPGMNIHRNPLCGRNFEYYSEDPVVSGVMAGAITEGVQSLPGLGVTIKHFACNNQEDNRNHVSSIVSERALREIYLKGFEIAVKQAQPMAIMTSYNRVNSVHAANSFDLCTTAARDEWGFGGIIMTDWLTTNHDHGSSAAKCVLAGNDLTMPGNESDIREILDALEEKHHLSLPEQALDSCVLRMLETLLASDIYEGARPYADLMPHISLLRHG